MAQECPKCGCADVVAGPVARQLGRLWHRWVCQHCGHVWPGSVDDTTTARVPVGDAVLATVVYVQVMCPYCMSVNTHIVRTVAPIRYHACLTCGRKFRSEQA